MAMWQTLGFVLVTHELANAELRRLASIDVLTDVFNRRAIETMAIHAIARAGRVDEPCALALRNADDVKQINDSYGHAIGNQVLRELVSTIVTNVREQDIVWRFGDVEAAFMLSCQVPGGSAMCYMLYLGSARLLPSFEDDATYPKLTVELIKDPIVLDEPEASHIDAVARSTPYLRRIRHLLRGIQYVYDVRPEGLCGCYFEHTERAELEAELQDAPDIHLRSWVSSIAYPNLDPKEGARRWWERKHTAVASLGWYLSDHVQDGALLLYVVWSTGTGEQRPVLEQQSITPAYFTQATSLALPEHMLFTIVAKPSV